MRTTKDFLEQEHRNLVAVLEETLRFKYGIDGSLEFFEECRSRLGFVAAELARTPNTDIDNLQRVGGLILELSGLLSRIERSSVGEYSWPFVEELKRIAVAICTEATLTKPDSPPMIHVLSDGGLDQYQIFTESNRPSSAGRRILTIVVPRTLKHFVLLHSILGHEIGHAMWQCSTHQNALKNIVNRHLFSSGTFANPAATSSWLFSPNAPAAVKSQLAMLNPYGINQTTFFNWAQWPAWIEEIICDLIGLLTFGPSFVAAEANLLYSMNPSGAGLGQRHPPVGCRINYLLTGVSLQSFDGEAFKDANVTGFINSFWSALKAKKQADPWFDVFTDAQLKAATDEMSTLLASLPPARYSSPTETDLRHLLEQLHATVPPTGFQIDGTGAMNCRPIDFRHTLYAGWVVGASSDPLAFERLNRLCQHGIMQQRAIDTMSS